MLQCKNNNAPQGSPIEPLIDHVINVPWNEYGNGAVVNIYNMYNILWTKIILL